VAAFAYEMGVLKRIRRSGWWHVGVRDPESIAEHSFRVAQRKHYLNMLQVARRLD
jgi:putative hydrolase of HD superfamily